MVEPTAADPQPGARTPERRARSVRWTTTHDCTRLAGLDGPVSVSARGRQVHTGGNGRTTTTTSVALDVDADPSGAILRLRVEPAVVGLDALVGVSAYAGFRRATAAAVPSAEGTDLLRQVLDDLPTALMLSGRVLRTNGISLGHRDGRLPIDICAGWVADGTLVAGYGDFGPPLRRGPNAVATERADDPRSWHDHDPLPAHATRRRRRLDVWLDGDEARVAAFFRDTHAGADAIETVVHQYAVDATIDLDAMTIRTCAATPGPLPYPECPGAAASAVRLQGTRVDGLRRAARQTLVGPTTCTHLTDALGCLEGAGPMVRSLVAGGDDRA